MNSIGLRKRAAAREKLHLELTRVIRDAVKSHLGEDSVVAFYGCTEDNEKCVTESIGATALESGDDFVIDVRRLR